MQTKSNQLQVSFLKVLKDGVPDGQLQVTWNDPCLLVVPGGVAGELEDLGGQVFHHGGKVDGGTGAHPLGIVALPEHPMDPAHRELEAGTG